MLLTCPENAKLYFDEDMQDPAACEVSGGEAIVFCGRSPGKDTPNEDAAAVIPYNARSSVLVVADGLGGVPAGEQASSLAIETLRTSIVEASRNDSLLRTAIINGIEQANEAVLALGVGAGTTLAIVEVHSGTIRPYHVGDSMILVTGQRGKLKLQTISHSPVGYAIEAGVLDEDEALHHEERHVVSNTIGTPEMRIEIGSALKLARRDTVLLASDGLFDNLHVEEIVETSRKGPLPPAVQTLVREARRRMEEPTKGLPSKPDDLTCVGFRLKG